MENKKAKAAWAKMTPSEKVEAAALAIQGTVGDVAAYLRSSTEKLNRIVNSDSRQGRDESLSKHEEYALRRLYLGRSVNFKTDQDLLGARAFSTTELLTGLDLLAAQSDKQFLCQMKGSLVAARIAHYASSYFLINKDTFLGVVISIFNNYPGRELYCGSVTFSHAVAHIEARIELEVKADNTGMARLLFDTGRGALLVKTYKDIKEKTLRSIVNRAIVNMQIIINTVDLTSYGNKRAKNTKRTLRRTRSSSVPSTQSSGGSVSGGGTSHGTSDSGGGADSGRGSNPGAARAGTKGGS